MILFVLGFILGINAGVLLMAMMFAASRRRDEHADVDDALNIGTLG